MHDFCVIDSNTPSFLLVLESIYRPVRLGRQFPSCDSSGSASTDDILRSWIHTVGFLTYMLRILYHSDQLGELLSSGGPPAGFSVQCHQPSGDPPLGSTLCYQFFSVLWRRLGQSCVTSRRPGQGVTVIRPAATVIVSNFLCHQPTPHQVGQNGTVSSSESSC